MKCWLRFCPGKPENRDELNLWRILYLTKTHTTRITAFFILLFFAVIAWNFFEDLNLKGLMGEDWKQPESDIWKSLNN